jgi:hypothetical protein
MSIHSSTSSPIAPPSSTSERLATCSRDQKRWQRTEEFRAAVRPEPLSTSKGAWEAYFQEQEARGIEYEGSNPSPSTRNSSTALLSRDPTLDVGSVRAPSNFRVLNLQAQHLIIHDSSSGQLVEATMPSINFSQSAALQNILHPQTSSQSDSPS